MKCFSLLVVVAWFAAGQLQAQDVTSGSTAMPEMRVRSYGDERSVDVSEEMDAFIAANAGLEGSVRRESLTFKEAMARVDKLAQSAGGEKVLGPALKALPNDKPDTLRLLAVREFVRGRTTSMFLLVYAAYRRAPESPDTLFDLAGVLAGLGYANEALAILEEMERSKKAPAASMGIASADFQTYLRAYCLVRLGDAKAARPMLRQVVQREPTLAEAARLLALVAEDDAERRKNFILGVWRHRGQVSVSDVIEVEKGEPDAMTTGEHVGIDLRTVLDLSKGKPGKLPDVTHARSAAAAFEFARKAEGETDALGEKLSTMANNRKVPKGFKHTDDDVFETRGHRMLTLLNSIDYRDPKVRELAHRRHVVEMEAMDEHRRIESEKSKQSDVALDRFARDWVAKKIPRSPTPQELAEVVRPFHEEAFAKAGRVANRREKAERDYFAEWYLLASAVPAQVGDQAWHAYLAAIIEHARLMAWRRLLWISASEARIGEHPFLKGEPGDMPPMPPPQALEKCDGSKSVGFSTNDFPIGHAMPFEFGVEMTCEGASVEVGVDTRIPGISVSTEIGVDNKGGFTAFVGPKAELNIGDKEIAAFTASAKAGVYVSGNKNEITDAGIKYEAKVGGRIGAVSGAHKVADDVLIRFMPAPVSPSPSGVEPLGIYRG